MLYRKIFLQGRLPFEVILPTKILEAVNDGRGGYKNAL